jgi:hypothetical protein
MKTFLGLLKALIAIVRRFFKRHPEFVTLPIALCVWLVSVPVLRMLDATAAVFDAGIFQIPVFSTIQMLVYLAVAWAVLKLVFGRFYKFMRNEMKWNFEQLTPWQKLKLAYSVYFLLFASLVLLARSIA